MKNSTIKGSALVMLLVIVVVVIAGYFAFTKINGQKRTTEQAPVNVVGGALESAKASDSQTYLNAANHFQLTYPKSWHTYTDTSKISRINFDAIVWVTPNVDVKKLPENTEIGGDWVTVEKSVAKCVSFDWTESESSGYNKAVCPSGTNLVIRGRSADQSTQKALDQVIASFKIVK